MKDHPILFTGEMVRAILDESKRGFGWDVNPWVWVVTFKRIKP